MSDYLIICSAPEDQGFMKRFADDLRVSGVKIWGGTCQSGADKYAIGVAEAIKSASGFIYICSYHSLRSSMLKMELAAANRAAVPVIMVSIDDVGYNAAQKTSSRFTKFDFRGDYQAGLDTLISHLKSGSEPDAEEAGPGGKPYVFLSYAEQDTVYMNEVKAFMSKKGYGYWEFQGSERDYQVNLALDLEKALRGAKAIITILSPSWKQSKWSMREFLFSQQVGIPGFLLRFEDVEPTLAIADILYIDFVGDKKKGFERLDRELARVFESM